MQRDLSIQALQSAQRWDVLIVGGGATGLGAAVDSAARGYRTALIEQGDFAHATSSRSTKLIHGGVRYLQQGNLALVREALRERARLLQNAPGIVHALPFVIPAYARWEPLYYGLGLKVYDALAGKQGIGASRRLSREETQELLPGAAPEGLCGGVLYYDAQFDDARLAIALMRKLVALGGIPLNYARVVRLEKSGDTVTGVRVRDEESGNEWGVSSRVVVNATGVLADDLRVEDDRQQAQLIAPSQGTHVVLGSDFLPGTHALMIPRTQDGRVLFAIPWHDRTLLGTTDTAMPHPPQDPRPLPEEIAFLLDHARRHLRRAPGPGDVLSAFAGLRPLIKKRPGASTASLSRDHFLEVSRSGLVTITGGKWTTYRKMAEDTINAAARVGGLPARLCPTATLPIEGQATEAGVLPSQEAVRRAVTDEMARTVEDVLSRRSRALLLDARASAEYGPQVALWMGEILGKDPQWCQQQAAAFQRLSAGFVPTP
jgi:glycerol-3-phosphate dehydrogenase